MMHVYLVSVGFYVCGMGTLGWVVCSLQQPPLVGEVASVRDGEVVVYRMRTTVFLLVSCSIPHIRKLRAARLGCSQVPFR